MHIQACVQIRCLTCLHLQFIRLIKILISRHIYRIFSGSQLLKHKYSIIYIICCIRQVSRIHGNDSIVQRQQFIFRISDLDMTSHIFIPTIMYTSCNISRRNGTGIKYFTKRLVEMPCFQPLIFHIHQAAGLRNIIMHRAL